MNILNLTNTNTTELAKFLLQLQYKVYQFNDKIDYDVNRILGTNEPKRNDDDAYIIGKI